MTTDGLQQFDARLDDFLRGTMPQSEQQAFISELKASPELLQRAQVVALAISQMHQLQAEQGDRVVEQIRQLGRDEFLEQAQQSPLLQEFDSQVTRFLTKRMSEQEQKEFKQFLTDHPQYRQRAITIASAITSIDGLKQEQSRRVADAIAGMDEPTYRQAASLPAAASQQPRVVPLWPRIARWTAAACLAGFALFGGYRYHQFRATVGLGTEYAQAIPEAAFTRGADEVDMTELTRLLANVQAGKDLKATARRLSELYRQATGEEYTDYTPLANTIGWNAAIAYLKDGNRRDARAILVTLRDQNPGKALATKAQELINKLDAI